MDSPTLRSEFGIFDSLVDPSVIDRIRNNRYDFILYNIGLPIHANWMIKLVGEAQKTPTGSDVEVWFDHAMMCPSFTRNPQEMWKNMYSRLPVLLLDSRKMDDKWIQITGRDPSSIPQYKEMDPRMISSLPDAWEYASLINQKHLENIETSTAVFKASWMLAHAMTGTSERAQDFQEDFNETLRRAMEPIMKHICEDKVEAFTPYFSSGILPDCDIRRGATISTGMYYTEIDSLINAAWKYARTNGFGDSYMPLQHLTNIMKDIVNHASSDTLAISNSFFSHVESCMLLQPHVTLDYKNSGIDPSVKYPDYQPEKVKVAKDQILKLFSEVLDIHHNRYGLTPSNDPFTAWVTWIMKSVEENIDSVFKPVTPIGDGDGYSISSIHKVVYEK